MASPRTMQLLAAMVNPASRFWVLSTVVPLNAIRITALSLLASVLALVPG
jgi:hypothetical protein